MVVDSDSSTRYGKVRLPTGFSMWRVDNEQKLIDNQSIPSSTTADLPTAIATQSASEQLQSFAVDPSYVSQAAQTCQTSPVVAQQQFVQQQVQQHSPSNAIPQQLLQQTLPLSPSHQSALQQQQSNFQHSPTLPSQQPLFVQTSVAHQQPIVRLSPQQSSCNNSFSSSANQLDSSNASVEILSFDHSSVASHVQCSVKQESSQQTAAYSNNAHHQSMLPFDLQHVQLQLPNDLQPALQSQHLYSQQTHSVKHNSSSTESSIPDQLLQDLFDCNSPLIDVPQSQPAQHFQPQSQAVQQQQAYNFQSYVCQPLPKQQFFGQDCMYVDQSYIASTAQDVNLLAFNLQQFVEQSSLPEQTTVTQVTPPQSLPVVATQQTPKPKLSPTTATAPTSYSFCQDSEI
jgi:hypothetical protein